jgi:hypothetical protein
MGMDPAPLYPVSDCTANYRPVLSSEKALYMKKEESNCQTKKIKIYQDELADSPSVAIKLEIELEVDI